ncbi:Fe-S-containing protein [Sulfurospirillum multivorans]|uniref:Membrane protein n=2 Tax=Sulfurospirillum multivorans TaxID=66821 RepID=A0AA86ANI5_SULMK|nr:Fe-S-containing protein [Sulfurospirillum multivorans]AHJ13951.1 membrane protein [Sulfurospirillum multivorans DSM 12446]QEH07439.1 membrane protein [Sulfurospirillum multivorans]
MSIYFIHVMQALLGFTLLSALWEKHPSLKATFLASFIGIWIGIGLFECANLYLWDTTLKLYANGAIAISLLLGWAVCLLPFKSVKLVLMALLAISFGIEYGTLSRDFPLLKGALLDTLSIVSLGIVILSACLLLLLYWLMTKVAEKSRPSVRNTAIALTTLFLLLDILGELGIALMRLGVLPTSTWLLSAVAKVLHYSSFFTYIYLAIVVVLSTLFLRHQPRKEPKETVGVIASRRIRATRSYLQKIFTCNIIIVLTMSAFMLFYDVIASRPPTISTPTILEPVNGEFKIPMELLRDNDLHRFAYITDEGNKIRFFLLNRYKEKDAPVAVFDACMICGDMGYVKKGDELICIACNVRIFIPSVGKEGGCNPIPFPYQFDGKEITFKLETILKGVNYFSEVVEKSVSDPVSGAKLINLKAPKTYVFGGKTYYFENNDTYEKFKENPERYVGTASESHWRAQGYQALGEINK